MGSAVKRMSPVVQLVVACALWGGVTVLNKSLLSTVAPVTLLTVQLAASNLALVIGVALSGAQLPPRRLMLPIVALGILNPGISYTLVLIGLATVPAGVVSLLWAAEPLLILVLAALLLREPVTPRLVAVMVVGLAGVALLANVGDDKGTHAIQPTGILLVLCAVLCCALYTVLSRKLSDAADPLATACLQQAGALAITSAWLVMRTSYGSPRDLMELDGTTLIAAATSGFLYYAAAYALYLAALRTVPAAVAGGYFNLIPVVGVGLAYFFLGETLSALQWLGAAAIVASALVLVAITSAQPAAVRPKTRGELT